MENIILTSCFWLFLFIVYKYSKPKRRLITIEDIFSKELIHLMKFNSDIKCQYKELEKLTSKK